MSQASKFAIVQIFGRQFKVTEGSKIKANFLDGAEAGQVLEFSDVCLVKEGDAVKVGAPNVAGAKVVARVESHTRDDKVIVFKYLRKNKLKKTHGHRQDYTILSITQIQA